MEEKNNITKLKGSGETPLINIMTMLETKTKILVTTTHLSKERMIIFVITLIAPYVASMTIKLTTSQKYLIVIK